MVLFSCKSEEELPEDILSEEKMVEVLIDIRIAEGKVGTLNVGRDSSRVLYDELERQIFERLGLDSATYSKSYQYYVAKPQLYLRVNDIVLDSLKVRQQRLDSPAEEN